MFAIPQPAFAGRLIGSLSFDAFACDVYWNKETNLVVFRLDNNWYASQDSSIPSTMEHLLQERGIRSNWDMRSFELFEHGAKITQPNDRNAFLDCEWSDYKMDGLAVRASFTLLPQTTISPPGGEPVAA